MSDSVIQVAQLGKRYSIAERERYRALRDVLAGLIRSPLRRSRNGDNKEPRTIWALRDVTFEVGEGEVIGLIGRNGAGKSTLLKILSRVTRPSEGHAAVRGRVGSLLEVGTGFHPELTGQENVYLSGAILGMSKREIDRKFDEIVAFAEVQRFLATPLKHYSTGMMMRLAFAVAAHLEPEILLIDEVLAVGDLQFQKKCLGKMSEVARGGRTILFVSHQMNQIRRLCARVIWLEGGLVRACGNTADMIAAYEAAALELAESGDVHCFVRWEFEGQGNILRDGMGPQAFRFELKLQQPVRRGHFGLHLYNDAQTMVASWGFDDLWIEAGLQEIRVEVPFLPLRPGTYTMMCSLYDGGNNLTGGRLLEVWHAVPHLSVDSAELAHSQDAWMGTCNIPGKLVVAATATSPAAGETPALGGRPR